MLTQEELWEQQCEAASRIRDDFGWLKGIGYLVGEKFLNFVRDLRGNPAGRARLEEMAQDVRELFPRGELVSYFKNTDRFGSLGHIVDNETYREMQKDGFKDQSIGEHAEDVILADWARRLILGDA